MVKVSDIGAWSRMEDRQSFSVQPIKTNKRASASDLGSHHVESTILGYPIPHLHISIVVSRDLRLPEVGELNDERHQAEREGFGANQSACFTPSLPLMVEFSQSDDPG